MCQFFGIICPLRGGVQMVHAKKGANDGFWMVGGM